MSDILEEICAKKRADLAAQKAEIPFAKMLARAEAAKARAPFKSALRAAGEMPAIIAELKKASPSAGLIRADFEPAQLAAQLCGAGAAALSVLTERHYFLGCGKYLETAAQTTQTPLLRKDFIFDEYQIAEARALGASAILLIAKMLEPRAFARLLAFAKSLGLDALCEAHNSDEAAMMLDGGAQIIGANCRNLRTFKIDFSVSERLLQSLPEGVVKVAESGVESRSQLLRARAAGADAALVGTALMSRPNPAEALKKLLEGA